MNVQTRNGVRCRRRFCPKRRRNGYERSLRGDERRPLYSMSALLYAALPIFTKLAYGVGANAETFNFYKKRMGDPGACGSAGCAQKVDRFFRAG